VDGGEARALARQIEPSKLMVAQGQVAVSSLDIGAGALQDIGQRFGFLVELILHVGTQRVQRATRLTQWSPKALGPLSKRLARCNRASLGHPVEIIRRNQPGMQGMGSRWRSTQLIDVLPHISRDTLDGGLHCGDDACGFADLLQARLTETLLLGDGANLIELLWDSSGKKGTVPTDPAFEIDKVRGMSDRPDALPHMLALSGHPLVFLAGHVERLLGVLDAHRFRVRGVRFGRDRLIIGGFPLRWSLVEALLSLGDGLVGRSHFGGQGGTDSLGELILHMEYIGRMVGTQMMGNVRQHTGGFITRRLHDLTVQVGQSRCHEMLPRGVVPGLSALFEDDNVPHGLHANETQSAGKGFVLGEGDILLGHVRGQTGGFGLIIGDNRFFDPSIDLVLSPRGRGDTSVQATEREQETHQAHATRPDLHEDEVERESQPMQEGEAGFTVKKLGDVGTDVEGTLLPTPSLQGGAGHLELRGGLTLGDPLGLELDRLLKPISPLEPVPTRVTVAIVKISTTK